MGDGCIILCVVAQGVSLLIRALGNPGSRDPQYSTCDSLPGFFLLNLLASLLVWLYELQTENVSWVFLIQVDAKIAAANSTIPISDRTDYYARYLKLTALY